MSLSLRIGVVLTLAGATWLTSPPTSSEAAARRTLATTPKAAPQPPRITTTEVKPQLRRFFGDQRGDYHFKGLLWKQVYDSMPAVGFDLEDGGRSNWLLWGDRPGDAHEGGAILLSHDRRIQAVALVYFDYLNPDPHALDVPLLVIFTRHSSAAADHVRRMRVWARAKTAKDHDPPYKIVWMDRPHRSESVNRR